MASSFISQIPTIVYLVKKLNPKSILDIGKGFGKYGFLLHEYVGIDNTKKIHPSKTLKELSSLKMDAVEVDPDLMLPHLEHLYQTVYFKDILSFYSQLPSYDLILMVDIIEHIPKEEAKKILTHFIKNGSSVLIATPVSFFQQELYESEYERHVSHWEKSDFLTIAHVQVQYIDAGAIYLLSPQKMNIRGFGNQWIKKLRRIARAVRNEFH